MIIRYISEVAYEPELSKTATIHPVFHVSQLRRVIGNQDFAHQFLPHLQADLELLVSPHKVA